MISAITSLAGRTGFRAAIAAAALSATLAVTTTDASAQYRRHWGYSGGAVAAGVVGGLAIGALAAGAARPYYRPAPVYVAPAPVYVDAPCYWERQRVWDGWGWRIQRVRVCE
ncbi:MAG: hypothetical protein AB7F96_05440 [Beijerinckiaceae bacterium]